MKVLQFTIPVAYDKTVIAEKVCQKHHYPYLHRHKEIQITWIRKGEGTLIAGNHMHDYTAGDMFFIGANMPHVFKSNPDYFLTSPDKEVEALTIFFNPEGGLTQLFDLPEMKQTLFFIQQHQQGFKFPAYLRGKISSAMVNLEQVSGIDRLIAFFDLLKLVVDIKTKLDPLSCGNLPVITDHEGIRIGTIYDYIIHHYGKELTLEDVAKIAFMTPESFCRYFKKHTGHTFVSFLNEVRINEACKKLVANRFETINTVAYKCGFKSITNFNRVFKLIIGITPKNYMDNYNQNILAFNVQAG
ncbi:AraC family transcriptional regulator [Mucilaginibacter sp. 3215]|uniref:AraC family transcriptional regulator n=1 Tax=Mucilaginibacter sp. 3215 TaxID=3373912 RepID=UPI003D1AD498